MFAFEYETIENRPGGHRIRLITLAPSEDFTDPVHVGLSVAKLADQPTFEALSYCWGDAADKLLVFCEGQPFPVTKNLESALRHLRQADEERVLWIDAICINQNDTSERAYQVGLMRDIYEMASSVVVWLGDADDDSDLVFPLCDRMVAGKLELLTDDAIGINNDVMWGPNKKQVLEQKLAEVKRRKAAAESEASQANEEACSENGGDTGSTPSNTSARSGDEDIPDEVPDATGEEAAAFLRLIARPWFTRCWVLQEVCLGRETVVLCGTKSIGWEIFYVGFTLALLLGVTALKGRPEQILRGGLIFMMSLRMRLKHPDESQERVDLLWLLRQVLSLEATDPRDKVYSILGLISEEESQMLGLVPDYTISVEECYKRAALAIMSRTKNLDILLTERMPSSKLALPSWAPDWSFLERPAPTQLVRDVDRDDKDDSELRPFQASAVEHWEPALDTGTNALTLSGYVFDRIVLLENVLTVPKVDHLVLGSMNSSMDNFIGVWRLILTGLGSYLDTLVKWEKLAFSRKHPTYPTGEDPETVFAITMCAGNAPGGPGSALVRFRKWRKTLRGPKMLTWLKGLGVNGGIYKSIVAATGFVSGINNLEDRVYATATERTLYRRLARTEKGYLAVVPSQSVVGDQVALFQAGKTPFVVRPKPDSEQKAVLGPCYVHGIMYGEAWDDALPKDIEVV